MDFGFLECEECGGAMEDLGPQYGPVRLARCLECGHEEQYVQKLPS